MRTTRALTIAAAVIAILPTVAAAQRGRDFKDAWFWGIKAGGFAIADSGGNTVQAPMVGVDWLITRTHGGVYVAASETFFSQHTLILQDPANIASGLRSVSLKNLTRIDAAMMGFPGTFGHWHPYAGVGFTFSDIGTTRPEGTFASLAEATNTQLVLDEGKSSFAPLFLGGAQYRLRELSVFGQLSISPTQNRFLLTNGKSVNFGYEFGLRYNIGSSIERDDQ